MPKELELVSVKALLDNNTYYELQRILSNEGMSFETWLEDLIYD